MGSCVSTLRRIQADTGITDKDLKRAVHHMATPREVTLEEISVTYSKSEIKQQKQEEKLRKKTRKKRRDRLVYWYLEEYLKPEYAYKYFYTKYDSYEELADAAYEAALDMVQLYTFNHGPVDPEEAFPEKTVEDEHSIPDSQWEAYGEYLKKHPFKKHETILQKREKFLKSLRKTKRKYYSKKNLRKMYDPLFSQTVTDEKELLKNFELITKQNEERIQEFQEMLESLYKDNGVSKDVMKKFDKQTKQLMEHHRRRLNEFIKRTGKEKPTPVTLDMDDEPRVSFDDWDDPDSIDSVLRIPIKDC